MKEVAMRPPPPPPPPPPRDQSLVSAEQHGEELKPVKPVALKTPLKEAGDLIQTLEISCIEMSNCATDAAHDAEIARKNARAASEIARRYTVRSFPKSTTFVFGSSPPRRNRQEILLSLNSETKEDTRDEMNGNEDTKFKSESRNKSQRTNKHPTSMEKIAQSHADEILALSIELEKAKQALKLEQKRHLQTKAKMDDCEAKRKDLQNENETLQERLEANTKEAQEKEGELEQKLAKSKLLLEAAEEDAQLALELAKDSTEKRDEMDELLKKALRELQALKQTSSDKRMVRFADNIPRPPPPPPLPSPAPGAKSQGHHSPPRSLTPRAMVAAGRQLLRRSTGTPDQEIVNLELTPKKSADRRRRLRERLMQKDETDGIPSPRRLPAAPKPDPVNQMIVTEDLLGIGQILQDSGQRLDLGGHWWRDDLVSLSQDFRLEAMARQYCQSVEVKIDRQQKDLNELESLCGFLENKLVNGEQSK